MNLSPSSIGAALAALAGVIGTILTPLLGPGSSLPASLQAVLQAVSGILIAIPVWHVGTVAASNAKIKNAQKAGLLSPSSVNLHL